MASFRRQANLRRMYATTVRGELERFPVWPLGAVRRLGDIGVYDKKSKDFSWQTSLASLGMQIEPHPPQKGHDDLFTSSKAGEYSISVGAGSLGEASFQFGSTGCVVSQTTNLKITQLPEEVLLTALRPKLQTGEIEWDYRWRLVTTIFCPSTVTIAVNIRKNTSLKLRTSVPVTNPIWNIADAKLGVSAAAGKGATWKAIAKTVQVAWFETHYFQILDGGKIALHKG